jgi:hypothetical protein
MPPSVSVYKHCGKHTKNIGDDHLDEQKYSYYVNIQSHDILSEPNDAEWDFKIKATKSQVALLERLFDKTDETDWESYFRAHIPYLEYHHQPENKEYDQRMVMIYTLLYYLGDEKARTHISNMGILSGDILKEQPTQGGQEF